MKMKYFIYCAIFFLPLIGCKKKYTEYNGFIKNSTSNIINFQIIGDSLLFGSVSIPSGGKEKIYYLKENGQFEIYDCRSFFDTIYYQIDEDSFFISKDSALIETEFNTKSNEIKTHNCTINIK